MVTGRPAMISNSSTKSARCIGRILASALRPALGVVGQDHLPHGDDPVGLEEHVLGAAQADALGAELDARCARPSGVSALVRTFRRRLASAHSISVAKSPESCGSTVGTAPSITVPAAPSMVITSPSATRTPLAVKRLLGVGDDHLAGAADAGLAHAARDHGGVAGHAAARGQDALGGVHAVDVLGRGLDPHQDHGLAGGRHLLGMVGAEHDLAGRRARRGRQALGDDLALGLGVERRVQQLVERGGIDAQDRLLAA